MEGSLFDVQHFYAKHIFCVVCGVHIGNYEWFI